MSLTIILSVGLDPLLLERRNRALKSAGYIVVEAYSINEAVSRFQDGDFDLVLLCQSIPAREKDRLTSWIRASGSHISILSITEDRCEQDEFANARVESDADLLLLDIRRALHTDTSEAKTLELLGRAPVAISPARKPPLSTMDHEERVRKAEEELFRLGRSE